MSRPRRVVTSGGYLECTRCKEWKFIGEYNTQRLIGDGIDELDAIWYVDPTENDKQYGRPSGYCRRCMNAAARGKGFTRVYLEEVVEQRAYREAKAKYEQDEIQAYKEDAARERTEDLYKHFPELRPRD
jgi:hypothetical protein